MRSGLALLALAVLLCAALAELVLRLATPFPIHRRDANRIPHEALGYVVDPALPGIDAAGFRNPEGLGEVAWAAIGDSHTYGFNVRSEESWPAQLAARSGRPVYNYGVGGYGILQYRWLFDEALARSPEAIVLALYPANDLADYCSFAALPYWQRELARRGLDASACAGGQEWLGRAGREESPWQRSALGSALRQLVFAPLEGVRHPERFVAIAYGQERTLLSRDGLRLLGRAAEAGRPDIAAALAALELFLDEMVAAAGAAGVRFGVLLVPSKADALFEAADASQPFAAELEDSVRKQRDLAGRVERLLRARGVAHASARDCLQARLDRPLYPRDDNGHPTAAGYACYAEAAAALLDGPW